MKRDLLHPADILALPDEELRGMSPNCALRPCSAGVQILAEGEPNDGLYFILSGRVKISVSDGDDDEFVLAELGAGDTFGNLVLDGAPRATSAVALDSCRFLFIPGPEVGDFMRRHSEVMMWMFHRLLGHTRALILKARSLASQTVYQRLVDFLESRAERQPDGTRVVPEGFTHAELGRHIGASREMVSRVMRDLVTGGYIFAEKHRVVLTREMPRNW